ncbi:MAG: PilT/PilU family type 4a pilus ATPase [Candidatus Omnitrophota bacterium]
MSGLLLNDLIDKMNEKNAASMHISAGLPPLLNIHGRLVPLVAEKLAEKVIDDIAIKLMNAYQQDIFTKNNSINFTWNANEKDRVRITFFRQRGLVSGVFRPLAKEIPTLNGLNLPESFKNLLKIRTGLIIIGGPTGSGKSSTLAAILNEINCKRGAHIVTIEDPIEYFFSSNKSLISQREVGIDSESFPKAMREAVRQDADVIMIGEMRDLETVRIALNAAEAGTLVIGTMPTSDCVQTITRLIGMFPPDFQNQVRTQVAAVIKAIICQQLVMRSDGEARLPAVEIMFSTQGIRNLIREQKFHQVYSVIESSNEDGMQTLDQSLQKLYKVKAISDVEVVTKALKPEQLQRKMYTAAKDEIPEADTGPGFTDMGEDIITIEKKIIRYQADFSSGQEGFWTSSVAVIFQEAGMLLSKAPGNPSNRLYVSDFNIVSKKKASFALPYRLLIRFKLAIDQNNIPDEEQAQIMVKLFTQPQKDKPTAFNKINLAFPLPIDEKWHTWVINIPDEGIDKMLKISMFEFPFSLTKVTISDMLFF